MATITREEFGERLKTAREATGYTQTEAAKLLGVSQPYLSDCERGVRLMSVLELVRAVNALGLDPGLLLIGIC
jgi:transcriptional regulator with XRE-family HTH domain